MEKTATLNLRVNPTVKERAEKVLSQLGVSDISHQVRTSVSNMKMIVDTLLTKPLEDLKTVYFLPPGFSLL